MNRMMLCGPVMFVLSLFMIQCSGSSTLPLEISGRWTTEDASYKGEYIEISTNALVLGSESKGSFRYTIKKVATEKGPMFNTTLYRISCIDETGEENLFSFVYSPGDGGTLRYKSSQDTVWKKS